METVGGCGGFACLLGSVVPGSVLGLVQAVAVADAVGILPVPRCHSSAEEKEASQKTWREEKG
jgi:hypothetical protein